MTINFSKATLKALPNGNTGLSVSLSFNDNTAPSEANLQTVAIDTTTLTAPQLKCMNDFLALLNSKL